MVVPALLWERYLGFVVELLPDAIIGFVAFISLIVK